MRMRAIASIVILFLLLPVLPVLSQAQTAYIEVYQQTINNATYTVAVAPDGTVIANNTNATLSLSSAISYANNNQLDIIVKPGTYDLYPVGTTPGLYKYPYALWVNASGVHIYADPNAVFMIHGEATIVLGSDVQGVRIQDVGWHGGVIDGRSANFTKSHGIIVVFQADYYTIEGLKIVGSPLHGIHALMASSHGTISNNILIDIKYQAISLDGADYTVVRANSVINASAGINLQTNSDLEANGGDGVPEYNIITENRIEDVTSGIIINGGSRNSVVANTIYVDITRAASTYGILLGSYYSASLQTAWAPHYNTITGNIVSGARYALTISGYPNITDATYNIITSNIISNSQYYLLIKYARNNTIGPNMVDVTGSPTIILGDGAVSNYIAEWNIYEAQADVVLPQPEIPTVTISEKTVTLPIEKTYSIITVAPAPPPEQPDDTGLTPADLGIGILIILLIIIGIAVRR